MASSLSKYIQENIVKPNIENICQPVIAKVIYYDHTNNRASIVFNSTNGSSNNTILTDVMVQLGSGGAKSAGPFKDDLVYVVFRGGDIKSPMIVSLVDEDFKNKTRGERSKHMRKGAMVPHTIGEVGSF